MPREGKNATDADGGLHGAGKDDVVGLCRGTRGDGQGDAGGSSSSAIGSEVAFN